MTLDVLQKAKIEAIKNKNPMYKEAVSAMIDAVQKASITPKGRIEITEQLIDEVLIKYQKTIQEMIDTCPAERTDLLEKYQAEMEVVKLYAPQLMTDPEAIRKAIVGLLTGNYNIELTVQNRGKIMKTITPYFKGKGDMKIVSQVVSEMLV
jgi:uncharacterized protein YqeY